MLAIINPVLKQSELLVKYLKQNYNNKDHQYYLILGIIKDMILPENPNDRITYEEIINRLSSSET